MRKVVCITSWPPRINYVAECIKALRAMEPVAPDEIYLTLSREEFPGGNDDLPKDLMEQIDGRTVILLWTLGNRKAFKKVFPVLPYLDEHDLVMTCDDDIVVMPDLLASRLEDFYHYGGQYPITANNQMSFHGARIITPTMLFQVCMLAHWDEWVDEAVYATQNDDRTYLWALYLNGFIAQPCTKYSIDSECATGVRLPRRELPRPMTAGHVHLIGRVYDAVVLPIIEKMTGKNIDDSFGYFNK